MKFAGENFDEIVCFLGVAEALALVNLGVLEIVENFEVLDRSTSLSFSAQLPTDNSSNFLFK